jgi:uncharacterized membrane protein
VVSLCASSVVTGDTAIIYRAILIAAFLVVTTPISAFVIARAAYLRGERMEAPTLWMNPDVVFQDRTEQMGERECPSSCSRSVRPSFPSTG